MDYASVLKFSFVLICIVVVLFVVLTNWDRFRKKPEEPESAAPRRAPLAWPLKLDGQKAFVMKLEIEAGRIVLGGWDTRAYQWMERDMLEIFAPVGSATYTTRYRIEKITIGHGMYAAECRFAPRDAYTIARSMVGR